ncbi:MAG: ice-binding family protein [Acidimicrobiales bacterium]
MSQELKAKWRSGATLAVLVGSSLALAAVGTPAASAAQPTVGLGSAAPFSVLAGQTVTNTGPSVLAGELGVSPGSAVTGFPPGSSGAQHVGDAVASQAQSDLTTAYNDAAGRTPATTESNPDLGGKTLIAGVYKVATAMSLTGTVTLDAQGDPNAVFIFQAGSTLVTASSATVVLLNGAQPCNVWWQVGSSATLGTNTRFVGTVMALTSATVQTGTTVAGRVLARNGQVSLDTNTFTGPACNTSASASTTTSTASTSAGVPGATNIHTGKPWAGALPYEEAALGIGFGLIGLGFLIRRRDSHGATREDRVE